MVFVQFKDHTTSDSEWPADELPNWASYFLADTYDSQGDYPEGGYSKQMYKFSYGNLHVIGDYYPQLVITDKNSYEYGDYGDVNQEVLEQIDASLNFAQYDNLDWNGDYDIVPGTDGDVDMIIMMYRGIPPSGGNEPFFFWGIAELGLNNDFQTNDSKKILKGYRGSGVTCVYLPGFGAVTPFADAVGLAVHEVGHYFFGGGHLIYNFATLGAMSRQNGGSSFCSLERRWLGWIDFDYVDAEPTTLTLHDFFTTGEAGAVRIGSTGNRWFIIENRQKIDPLDKAKHPGIYVYYFHGIYNNGLDISTADGRWNWTINPSTQQPEKTSVNPSTGTSKLQLYNAKQPPGYNGDNLDPFNVGYETILQPNINPSSYTRDGTLTNIAMQLTGVSDGVFTLKVYKNVVSGSVSGTISQHTTWGGNISVTGTVTLNSGYMLTILPGTTINFASGTSLIAYGKLLANGTPMSNITFTKSSGTYYGFTISGSGASGSSISNANIQYALEISVLNGASDVVIEDCVIENCAYGIRYNSSSEEVLNCELTSNTGYHGIVVEGSTVRCSKNIVTKASGEYYQEGAGILYSAGSNGNIYQNIVQGWNWGIAAIWGSSPHFTDGTTENLNNEVTNCKYGLRAYNSSWPVVCPSVYDDYQLYWGNSIRNNSPYNVHFTSGGNLWANFTYWGATPPVNFYASGGSTIRYDDWLTSDPWLSAAPWKEQPMDSSMSIAFRLRREGKYREAFEFLKRYILKNPNDQAAYVELYNCYNNDTAGDLISFFSPLPDAASDDHNLLLSQLYLRQGNAHLAREVNDGIIANHANTPLAGRAKLNNAYISLYSEKDVDRAVTLFNEVASRSDLSTEIELSLVQQAIESRAEVLGKDQPQLRPLSDSGGIRPTETDLFQNYPNPYNPSTVIQYTVSEPSLVALKLYDILGRQIAVLVDEQKQPGIYAVTFDGSRLPSGVYFYHMIAGTKSVIKKMALAK